MECGGRCIIFDPPSVRCFHWFSSGACSCVCDLHFECWVRPAHWRQAWNVENVLRLMLCVHNQFSVKFLLCTPLWQLTVCQYWLGSIQCQPNTTCKCPAGAVESNVSHWHSCSAKRGCDCSSRYVHVASTEKTTCARAYYNQCASSSARMCTRINRKHFEYVCYKGHPQGCRAHSPFW